MGPDLKFTLKDAFGGDIHSFEVNAGDLKLNRCDLWTLVPQQTVYVATMDERAPWRIEIEHV